MAVPKAQDTLLLTNYDKTFVFRYTGDISAYVFRADVTDGDDTKLFSMSITLDYDAGAGYTTITCLITKEQIATLTVGNTYYSDLKLIDTIETAWVSFEMPVAIGKTTTAV